MIIFRQFVADEIGTIRPQSGALGSMDVIGKSPIRLMLHFHQTSGVAAVKPDVLPSVTPLEKTKILNQFSHLQSNFCSFSPPL